METLIGSRTCKRCGREVVYDQWIRSDGLCRMCKIVYQNSY